MTEEVAAHVALTRWKGERGTYHLVTFAGEPAETIAMHERLQRLEFGSRRGFGSVKVFAQIGDTRWKTSVFPQRERSEWILLVSKKVMRTEDLAEDDELTVTLELL